MIFTSRQVDFIFAQFSPAVCLPCKQTDFAKRIIAHFRCNLHRGTSKKFLKIENTVLKSIRPEISFSFNHFFQIFIYISTSVKLKTVIYYTQKGYCTQKRSHVNYLQIKTRQSTVQGLYSVLLYSSNTAIMSYNICLSFLKMQQTAVKPFAN